MQDDLRERLEHFIKSYGVKAKFISSQTDIPEYVICRFRHKKQRLDEDSAVRLGNWIKERGV